MIFGHAPSSDVRARELFSEDFGAAGAVWCCNRVFKALTLVLQYFFLLPVDNYFDDYWMFSAPWSMQLASFVLDRAVEVLCCHWKKEKHDSALPLPFLGLSFKVVDGQALCEKTKERKQSQVQEHVALKSAAPDEFNLSSIVGKLVFAGKCLCGPSGVHARRPFYQALKDISIHRKGGCGQHIFSKQLQCVQELCFQPHFGHCTLTIGSGRLLSCMVTQPCRHDAWRPSCTFQTSVSRKLSPYRCRKLFWRA